MTIPTFLALLMLLTLYVILRVSSHKPHRLNQILINRTGKNLAKQLIKDTKKRYPLRSTQWVIKKVLADLDKGKI